MFVSNTPEAVLCLCFAWGHAVLPLVTLSEAAKAEHDGNVLRPHRDTTNMQQAGVVTKQSCVTLCSGYVQGMS